jgi:hypothetical protein
MTEKANPSINRPAEAFKTAGAIAYGGSDEGFISPANSPTEISVQDGGIDESQLNAFDETSSASSLDVTIDGGEAFVFGSWIAIDTSTTVSLTASTAGQTVSVGWNKNGADDVIVGLDAAFSSASGDADQKIPLFTFDTDGSGVTNVVDERSFDQISADSIEQGAGSGLDADTVDGLEASAIGFTDEQAQDAVGSIAEGGDKVTVTYDDGANTLTVDTAALDEEEVEDAVNSLIDGGNAIATSYDDVNDTLSIDVTESDIALANLTGDTDGVSEGATNLYFTDERAQDAVGTILGVNLSYDDANNTITIVQGSGSGLDADTVDGVEASELGSDVSDDGTTVTNSSTDLNFTDNITASDDGDGTSTIAVDDAFVLNDGDTMSGDLSFEDDIRTLFGSDSDFSIQYVSTDNELKIIDETNGVVKMVFDKNGDVFIPNGDLDLGGTNTVTNLSEPVNNTDVATKEFTESVAQGLTLKDSVRVSNHDTNIDLSSTTDPNPIDGLTLNDGDRILLKHQTDLTENGIYDAVTATDPTTWVRSSDFDEDAEVVQGAFTFVRGGTHANESYVVITADPITVGTDNIEFAQFAAAGQLSGGQNVAVSGDVIDVSPQGAGSGLDADTLDGIEAADLGSDVSNNGTTVTNSSTDLNFTDNIAASDDGDGTSTIAVEQGSGSGLDADTVDGVQASALQSDRSNIEQTIKFGAAGATTTSSTFVTITDSDIAFDPSNYQDDNGNLEIKIVAHLSHSDFGTVFLRMFRQNAGTAVAGTEVSHSPTTTGKGAFGFAESPFIDFSNESGFESYQLQLRSDDGLLCEYNSVLLQMRT